MNQCGGGQGRKKLRERERGLKDKKRREGGKKGIGKERKEARRNKERLESR